MDVRRDLSGKKVKVINEVWPWTVGQILTLESKASYNLYYIHGYKHCVLHRNDFKLCESRKLEDWL